MAARTSWKRVGEMLVQAARDLFQDNAPQWAAAVSYYALLSTFPLLLAGASLASLFIDPEVAVRQAVNLVGDLLPLGGQQIEEVVRGALARRGTAGLLSTLALLWSGTRVFGTATQALNIAYDVDEVYGFWQRRLAELVMLLSVGGVFVLALLTRPLLRLLSGILPAAEGAAIWLATELAPILLFVVAFYGLFRYAPRRRPSWQAALPGAVLTALLFLLGRTLFLYFVATFGRYNLIYGSVAIVVVLVFWVWIAALLLLFGGEVVSHTQMMLVEGRTAEELEERHRARSPHRSELRARR